MKSRVFVSCAQHSSQEVRIARDIGDLLSDRGFEPYIAKEVQSVFEINSGIIRELKGSDCYLLVNFRREQIGDNRFRGSLFANQEFAIAYALGFQRILVINQTDVLPDGMLRYIGCNTDEFEGYNDCIVVVKRALDRCMWKSDYSRRLTAGKVWFSGEQTYNSPNITLQGKMLYMEIHNGRPDIAAIEVTGRLIGYRESDRPLDAYYELHSRDNKPSGIRSPLKATGKPGFSHTIFPKSYEVFDLLCIGESPDSPKKKHVYLNTALDRRPTEPLPITHGIWELQYQFCAIDFPLLTVVVQLGWDRGKTAYVKVISQDAS